jgi:hypothetical protein
MSMDVQREHGYSMQHGQWTCIMDMFFILHIFISHFPFKGTRQYIKCILAHIVPVTNIVATIKDDIVKDDIGHVHTVHAAWRWTWTYSMEWTCCMDTDMQR